MTEFELDLIVIIAFLTLVLVLKFIECSKLKKTKEQVAWSATVTDRYRCFDLLTYITRAQKDLCLKNEFCISNEDNDIAKEILSSFQKNLSQLYFLDSLPTPQCKRVSENETYFMFLLCCFLEKQHCNDVFNGHKMKSKTIKKTEYGSWGVPQYDATYEITDFALVYSKLLYISFMYLKSTKEFNYLNTKDWYQESLEKTILSKTIEVSQMC